MTMISGIEVDSNDAESVRYLNEIGNILNGCGFTKLRVHHSMSAMEFESSKNTIYSMVSGPEDDARGQWKRMQERAEEYLSNGINARAVKFADMITLENEAMDDLQSYLQSDNMVLLYTDMLDVRGRGPKRNFVLGIYYPDNNSLITSDLFHSFTSGGLNALSMMINAIKGCGGKGSGSFDLSEAEINAIGTGSKTLTIIGDKTYTIEVAKITASENPLDAEVKRLRNKYKELAKSMKKKLEMEVGALESYRQRIMENLIPMPTMTDKLITSGYSLVRKNSEQRMLLQKSFTLTVTKIVRKDRSGTGASMPVSIPPELQPKIPIVLAACIVRDKKEENKFVVEKMRAWEFRPDGTLGTLNAHPHVLGDDVCTGDVRSIFGSSLTLQTIADRMEKDVIPALSMFNPNSWYGLRANHSKLQAWAIKEKVIVDGE